MSEEARRPLTQGERTLVTAAFGPLALERVRLCAGPGLNPFAGVALGMKDVDAITLIRTIFFKDKLADDFSKPGSRALFMHEMTHVWQYQKLGVLRFALRYLWEFVTRGFSRKALYAYDQGKTAFANATLEAQAQMVEDYEGGADRTLLDRNLAGSGLYHFRG